MNDSTRSYHCWTDREMWDLYCWAEAKRRVGNIISKSIDLGTTPSNLGGQIKRARAQIEKIERKLGITPEQRERAIQEMLR